MADLNKFNYMLGSKVTFAQMCKTFVKFPNDLPSELQEEFAKFIKTEIRAAKRADKQKNDALKPARQVNRKNPTTLSDLPAHLHGLPSNKYGGNQLQQLRGFRGGSYGPVNKKHRAAAGMK